MASDSAAPSAPPPPGGGTPLRRLALLLALCSALAIASASAADAARAQACSWSGTWSTSAGAAPLTLTQSGDRVSGTLPPDEFAGTASGNRLSGRWTHGSDSGPFEFTMAGDCNSFTGTVGRDYNPTMNTLSGTRAGGGGPPPPAPATAPDAFSCGPHWRTFTVESIDPRERSGGGIRCAQAVVDAAGAVEGVLWYGEGQWEGRPYRHVGYATPPRPGDYFYGSAADLHGNGEAVAGVYRGNIRLNMADDWSAARVTLAWDEDWTRVESADYAPLPRPTTCGPNFEQYRASDLAGARAGSGLRCLFDRTVWFGNGEWGGVAYSHVGLASLSAAGRGSGGAGDLCGPAFGPTCNQFPREALAFAPAAPRGFDVTGAWGEAWR